MNDLKEIYRQIEIVFGEKAVNRIKDVIGKLLMRINDVENSRKKWRDECLELRQKLKEGKGKCKK